MQAAALEMVVECIHTMADFVLQCSSQARSRTSIVIFWWAICGYRPPLEMYYNDFDKMPASEKRVRAVLFDVLARQVREPDEALQEGALYGLSLLADPRTPGLIASVRAQLATEELRRMAGWAARFELR